jgi:hypothetical protein
MRLDRLPPPGGPIKFDATSIYGAGKSKRSFPLKKILLTVLAMAMVAALISNFALAGKQQGEEKPQFTAEEMAAWQKASASQTFCRYGRHVEGREQNVDAAGHGSANC